MHAFQKHTGIIRFFEILYLCPMTTHNIYEEKILRVDSYLFTFTGHEIFLYELAK